MTLRFGRSLNAVEKKTKALVDTHGKALHALAEKAGYASYELLTLGGEEVSARKPREREEAFKKRLAQLQNHYSTAAEEADNAFWKYTKQPEVLKEIKAVWKEAYKIGTPTLKRQLSLLYPIFFEGNVAPEMLEQLNKRNIELAMLYGDFKPQYEGEPMLDGKVEQKLKETRDPKAAKALTEAKLAIGEYRKNPGDPTVAEKIVDTVKLRNQFARQAGYSNYYSFQLTMKDIDEALLVRLLKSVKEMTDKPYAKLREKLDSVAMYRFGISKEEARLPWYQGGVNEVGILDEVLHFNPDERFKGVDPRPLLKDAAKLMGADADKMVDNSDLFPRPGKTPHWYMYSLRIPDDIRTIGNIDPAFQDRMGYTLATELHETEGHGLGYSFVSPKLPPLLRDLHGITTESDAMMMESLMYDRRFLKEVAKFGDKTIEDFVTKGKQYRLAQELITFRKNYLLITDFERTMYNMKDKDLTLDNVNKLWAQKTEEYLGVKIPPERNKPDWAYKIHFATAPVYYQYYFLAQLKRAQVHATIREKAPDYGILSKTAGAYLKKHRATGQTYPWLKLVERMTGKPLGTEALKAEFDQLKL